jgi:hypothetical protein
MQRTLISFDLGSIPTDETIESAVFSIHHRASDYAGQAEGTSSEIYRLNTAWSAPTWNTANTAASTAWTTPGGDYVGINGTTTPYAVNSDYVANDADAYLSYDVTTLVSEWRDGTYANYGLLMAGSSGNMLHFGGGDITLTVTTAVPEPSTLAMLCAGCFGLICYAWRHCSKRRASVA